MQLHQFRRFLRSFGFRDAFIVKRMFETFDVDHNDCLNFVEVRTHYCLTLSHSLVLLPYRLSVSHSASLYPTLPDSIPQCLTLSHTASLYLAIPRTAFQYVS